MKRLAEIAAAEGVQLVTTEGGAHTKVTVGERVSFVPRHNEINELTAKAIIKQLRPEPEERQA
jgi:hypothetical protein